MTTEPSPTEEATRLTDLARTSPTAKNARLRRRIRRRPTDRVPGDHEAVIVELDEPREAHVPHRVDLVDLAGLADLSQSHFSKAFKAAIGRADEDRRNEPEIAGSDNAFAPALRHKPVSRVTRDGDDRYQRL